MIKINSKKPKKYRLVDKTVVQKMNILVTGDAGFIGSHIAEYFLSEGYIAESETY